MDIYKYVESCTKINADQKSVDNVKWLSVPKSENINLPIKRNLPYHLEIEKGFYNQSNMEDFEETEYQNDEDTSKWRYQFADIRASVREIGLGWNVFSIIEKRYEESQQRYKEINFDDSDSDSNYSYTTAKSFITEDSYSTAIEDISIDSSIDKGRYKKNALISGLLQSAGNNLTNGDKVLTDYSINECDTSNLMYSVCNGKKNKNKNDSEEKLDSNNSHMVSNDKNMNENYTFRLLQSNEDKDVYVHPLKEQIKEDPVWQEFQLSRKGIITTETARQYYMSLPEDQFAVFEQVDKKKKSKIKRKVKKFRYTFEE